MEERARGELEGSIDAEVATPCDEVKAFEVEGIWVDEVKRLVEAEARLDEEEKRLDDVRVLAREVGHHEELN